jgi:phage terminase large subunit GpA-like protein
MHFPHDRDDEWFAQLTAEKLVTKYQRGFPIREWVKTRPRNEALDCRVYAMAAYKIMPSNRQMRQQSQPVLTKPSQLKRSAYLQ